MIEIQTPKEEPTGGDTEYVRLCIAVYLAQMQAYATYLSKQYDWRKTGGR